MNVHIEGISELERRVAELEERLRAKSSEHDAALAQQAALVEVLEVINASPGDLGKSFDAIVDRATRLCNATGGGLWFVEGETARAAGVSGLPEPFVDLARRTPARLIDLLGRNPQEQVFFHVEDLRASKAYLGGSPFIVASAEVGKIRTFLGVPLKDNGAVVGVFTLVRDHVRPFAEPQIALVRAFAAQALIAMKNARLFNETKEALERQTATSEVLKVISRSVSDAAPVFETILESCHRLFGLEAVAVYVVEGDMVRGVAQRGWGGGDWGRDAQPLANSSTGLAIAERRAVHYPDLADKPDLPEKHKVSVRDAGGLTVLYAPMLTEDRGVGSIVVSRKPAKPFSEKEIQLIQSFADQAAIAIQNTHLFNETKEALERQTASSEILRAIAGSPSDAQPVFESIVVSAVKRLRCDLSFVFLADDTTYRPVAGAGPEGQLPDLGPSQVPIDWDANFPSRALLSKETYYLPDWSVVELPPHERAIHELLGLSSCLYMPLIRDGEARGLLALGRTRPSSFSASDIAQAEAFRDQAIIALENARLFNETKEALERQTATSEILKVIAASPSDTAPVFEAIAHSANQLLGGLSTAVWRFEGDIGRLAAFTPTNPEADAALKALSPLPVTDLAVFVLLKGGEIAQLPDTEEGPEALRELARLRGYRAMLFVPLMQQGEAVGFVSVTRKQPGAFDPDDVSLLKTFADQATIAIQNARLFNETQEALERQQASAEILRVISSSPTDVSPVFDAIALTAGRLFDCQMSAVFRVEGASLSLTTTAIRGRLLAKEELPPSVSIDPIENYPSQAMIEKRTLYMRDFGAAGITEHERAVSKRFGFSSALYMPLTCAGECIGVFLLTAERTEAFTVKDIALAESFRDQAQIALENTRLFNETQEALQQQTATAEVLKVISRSAFDLQAVLDTLTNSAVELSGATGGVFALREGDGYRYRAFSSKMTLEFINHMIENPPVPGLATGAGRAILSRQIEMIADVLEDPDYTLPVQQLNNTRSILAVPLLRDEQVEGVFVVTGAKPGLFPQRQIDLAQTFADQALIAIENTRLFDEVQARTGDLTEALQQQTATSNVLQVISRSAFDLDTVFQTLVTTAVDLCKASSGTLCVRDGDVFKYRGMAGPEATQALQRYLEDHPLVTPTRGTIAGRAILSQQIERIADVLSDENYEVPFSAKGSPARSLLGVPLLGKAGVLGAIVVARAEPGDFPQRHVEILKTFADQAVIAIENARLFDEVQAKTKDLSESLEYQTAISNVLSVISRSPNEVQPVLDTIVGTARVLCAAERAVVWGIEGDQFRPVAFSGMDSSSIEKIAHHRLPTGSGSVAGQAAAQGHAIQLLDATRDPSVGAQQHELARAGKIHTILAVPLMNDGVATGCLTLSRTVSQRFDDRQVRLLQTFAEQAVIAIKNVRLFEEVQARTRDVEESLAQQTATADVLKVISRSVFDLQTVFETLLTTAVKLVGGVGGALALREGEQLRFRAGANPQGYMRTDFVGRLIAIDRSSAAGRAVVTGLTQYIPDADADPEFRVVASGAWGRSYLGVPLSRDGKAEGALTLIAERSHAFTPRHIELIQTFADQAVIAVENARLFEEVQARTRELEHSLTDLRKAQDRLVQSEKLASLGQLTAGIAHEIKNPLNFVNNFATLSRELLEELREALQKLPDNARADADDLMGMIDSNLEKVATHGKRADSIVKNMLLHSREGSGERTRVNVNAMVEEALNLGYHGARAEKPGFNVTIEKTLDPNAGEADLYLQEITRVLLNLISNGFYATDKRRQGEGPSYEPTLRASTRDLGHSVEIRIRDNGAGIPDEVRAKMFNPFFTTKPAGEGTGLGLSLSHDIVVKQHGGTLDVETAPGVFTEFILTLPREGPRA